MERPLLRRTLPLLIVAVIAGNAGWHARKWYDKQHEQHAPRRVNSPRYVFTNPLLDVELPEGLTIDREPHPFKFKIVSFINEQVQSKKAVNIAVYYRDLHDGPWFAINKNIEFNPASMMKVPVMIAWMKRAEEDPSVLQKRLHYVETKDAVPNQYTRPARTLAAGKSYSVDELLHYMMNYSDNRATSLLYHGLSDADINDVLDNMDVNNNPHDDANNLTIHGYSGFFRILYNAAYLNREMSEKALQLLSLQDFPIGIVAGVPKEVKVAAKFGEIVPENNYGDIQLHEFGIVYHPKGHYILGIMTRGHDFAAQAEVIREISKIVYSSVDDSIKQ